MEKTFLVPEEHAGQRLDKLLADIWPEESRARWQTLVKEGFVTVNGDVTVQLSYKTKAEDTINATIPPTVPSELLPQEMVLEILFEDEHLIVLNKPAGLTVHPAPGNWEGTLVNGLLAHCQKSGNSGLSGIGGIERPGIIHRLDKDTSGVMVVAKSDAAHRQLAEDFKDRNITRSYVALCYGVPVPTAGLIEGDIGRHPTHRTKMAVVKDGRYALTRYKVLESFSESASYVQLKLETGRTHQIRVHMAHKHHALLGDPLYGRAHPLKGADKTLTETLQNTKRQMLHAQELGFTHPITGENIHCTAEAPQDFTNLLNLLKTL
ncbi:MAG: RluA family pseudouridine synthase [Alphaproteobacteria bacterium]|nr:RluA family pseudouridine synthase [Alphaproteobacteria bacterium]MDD9919495.1 RluA family pseudouridine synthase [Alphaproteobacteria bacterium]